MIESLALDAWIDFDRVHPAPTFFARPAWALALAQAYSHMRPALLRIRTPRARLLMPSMQMRGGPLHWREYSAFPLGGYTCFMHEDGSLADALDIDDALTELGRFCDVASVVPWPLAGSVSYGTEHETGVVDLSNGIDAALAGVEGIFRRMAGQAERRGVTCAPSGDAGAVDAYYELLEASAKRWGLERPGIPKALISALVEHGKDDVEIWFAHAEGRAIAGGVVFYGSKEFFFWSAAMLAEYGRLRPSNALNFALMRAASHRGMLWYNLGSSEGLPGVARFKKEMGAQSLIYREVQLTGARFQVYRKIRRALRVPAAV
ncbi:MAG TPA: GNAT family N-acetyltransferase [Candidatus Baltobacteraceae bacterium]|jgi:hypothetical protein|nr:GNAT family N-acetyltransferase [Candidatus Baltobacteraceae bacterium]